jgi:manganese transport protein
MSSEQELAASPATTAPRSARLSRLRFAGPAFVAAVAYVDPGNFATNVGGGSSHGFLHVWVIVAASLIAMLIQYTSAKLGLSTGRNLAEMCRLRFPRWLSWLLWVQAEIVCMATDLAEVVGAALAIHLLTGMPLFPAALCAAVIAFATLALQSRGYRPFEVTILAFLAVVIGAFLYQVLRVGVPMEQLAAGLVPRLAGDDSVLLAAGIVGATVMPHAIYLHSALTQTRARAAASAIPTALAVQRLDVIVAMTLAGLVNLSILTVAAVAFHSHGISVDSLQDAHATLGTSVGSGAALAFVLALLAAGLASASVGTYAGQIVMQGFINRSIPLLVRRAITIAPALVVLALGADVTTSLVLSQVVLAFGIPFALVPLLVFASRKDIMGSLVNSRLTTIAGTVFAAAITALSLWLLIPGG